MGLDACWTKVALVAAASNETDLRTRDRLNVLILVAGGMKPEQAAVALGHSPRSGSRWVARINAGGIEALRHRPGSGAPQKLPADQEEAFLARVDAGPLKSDGVAVLRGLDMQRILAEEFSAHYSLPGVYVLLERLGRRYMTARPKHPDGATDEEQQRFTDHHTPLFSRKSPGPIRTRRSG